MGHAKTVNTLNSKKSVKFRYTATTTPRTKERLAPELEQG